MIALPEGVMSWGRGSIPPPNIPPSLPSKAPPSSYIPPRIQIFIQSHKRHFVLHINKMYIDIELLPGTYIPLLGSKAPFCCLSMSQGAQFLFGGFWQLLGVIGASWQTCFWTHSHLGPPGIFSISV